VISSADNDPDFTDEFCGFLQRCVANVDAVELLLLLSKDPQRSWDVSELRTQLAALANLSEADVVRCLDAFQQHGVIVRDADRRVRYRSLAEHDVQMATLARLYIERPVTLFRMIYALRDSKIKTFADAFRFGR
jgi:DNA-binding MarR family transcriptional regulator